MEENKIERPLMNQEEFEKYLEDNRGLHTFEAVNKFKSIKRAIKRGHVSSLGYILPKRPFNNRGNSSIRRGIHSRKFNETRKEIYEQLKQYKES